MTDIERMAREAGCFTPGASRNYWAVTEPALERFAALVRAQAREDAARVCSGIAAGYAGYARRLAGQHATHAAGQRDGSNECAAAIRALATPATAAQSPQAAP